MSMYALILTMLTGGSAVAIAPNEAVFLQSARRVAQLAQSDGGKSVMCAEVVRGADGELVLTAKEPILVWQRPVPVAVPHCDTYAALADPQSCRPYEQQRLDIERERLGIERSRAGELNIWIVQ